MRVTTLRYQISRERVPDNRDIDDSLTDLCVSESCKLTITDISQSSPPHTHTFSRSGTYNKFIEKTEKEI